MEIINYEGNSEEEKRRLFETAEWTLLRLNRTINEMNSWTQERDILLSDIYRLKIALSYSEKSLADPLIMHQSEELERLARLNEDMRSKIKSLTLTLMNAESTVSWNTERKLRNEMTQLKSQMANDKLHLAREIMYLRGALNEKETEASMCHEMMVKLDKYREEDSQVDIIFSELSRKLINTINDLSSELINERNKILKDNHSTENNILLKEMENKIEKILIDRELKIRAFKRDSSRLKTELAIVQSKNEKLREKTLEAVKRDFCGQTEFFESDGADRENCELIELIDEKDSLMKQLEMERTTAREALREFEKSVNETTEKIGELNEANEKINLMKSELMRLKIDNRSLKELKNNYKKKNVELGEENVRERESFITKINNLRGKLIKLNSDNKKIEGELILRDKKIREINEIIKELEVNITEKNLALENYRKNEENYSKKIIELNNEIEELKLNLINSEEKSVRINEEFLASKKINEDARKFDENLIGTFKENEIVMKENIEINLKKLIELENENGELKNFIKKIESVNLNKNVEATSKECQVIFLDENTCDTSLSRVESASIVDKNNSSACTERIVEGSCKNEDELIEEKDKKKSSSHLEMKNLEKIENMTSDKIELLMRNDDKSMRGNWTIKNKSKEFVTERILKNLEDTDRQLLSVKCELSKVRDEIRAMRNELKGKRFIIRRYQMENDALKEELARLRFGIDKLEEENDCLRLKRKK